MAKKLEIGINDFETWCNNNNSSLLLEWDYNKNEMLPNHIQYGSSKKVWWIGKCKHSFLASLNKRTSDGTGCPYCCESHAKFLKGFNDLETTNPELLEEWDYEKNELKPNMIMKGQHIKVWWKGKCGHSWLATPMHKIRGRGCPICDKESKTSFPEQAIFFYLKNTFCDVINRNRSTIDDVELDIFIPSKKIAIEYDGAVWHKNLNKDLVKNNACYKAGIILYRFREKACPHMEENPFLKVIPVETDKSKDLEEAIKRFIDEISIEVDVNLERDRPLIYNQYIVSRKENSLSSLYPKLASEWNYEKNKDLTPEMVIPTSPKKVWWVGKCGHTWSTGINTRVNKKTGCPYCNSGRLLVGFNDLKTINPDALKYWDYEKNVEYDMKDFTIGSSQKVWWKCFDCGKSYLMSINNKIKHPNSCPYCSHRIVNEGVTDLMHINPSLANEWDNDKNGKLKPNQVTPSSKKMVWWLCPKGHSYKSTVYNRTNGRQCPICSGRKFVSGINDFATSYPKLLNEWDYEKNLKLPSQYGEHQRVFVWWKDEKGHSWKQTIEARSYGHGCPICKGTAKKKVLNIDTGVVYESLSDASKDCGLKSGDSIGYCCKGKQKTAAGYHWKFIEE